MQIVIDVPEKYYKDAKRMVWSSTYSGSLISGWLRNAIPVTEKDGYFVTDDYDYTANMCTTGCGSFAIRNTIETKNDER